MKNAKILIVEDEEDIRNLILFNLTSQKFLVLTAEDGEEALQLTKKESPDLILLDIMLPKLNGLEVCEQIKNNDLYNEIPIIMLTARGDESDIVKGLEIGADDYITKPFSPKILVARINALLRRVSEKKSKDSINEVKKIFSYGIEIDPDKRKCMIDGKESNLTYSEFEVLFHFMQNPGRVFTRSQIVEKLRGENHAITDRSVDVLFVGLRKRLGGKGQLIETVRGVGYRFKDEGEKL